MPRRHAAPKRKIIPDPLYGNVELAKFINCLMKDGKRTIAEKIVYGALTIAADRLKGQELKVMDESDDGESGSGSSSAERPIAIFQTAIANIRPRVEVKSRRVGGSTYQVPIEVRAERSLALAMRWLINFARKRSEHGMILRLANEIVDAVNGRGAAVRKREDTHKMANANKAFAHYRW